MERSRWIAVARVLGLIIVAVALQTLVFSHVTVLRITVDVFVIFTVIVAASWGPLAGCIFGFAAGIAADVAYLDPLGLHALVYSVVGYVLGVLAARLRVTRPRTILLYTLGSSFSAKLVLGLIAFLMGPGEGFFTMLGTEMIPGAVLDALVAVPVFLLLVKIRVIAMMRAEVGKGGEAT